jgi:Flp pilus assembly protein TadD
MPEPARSVGGEAIAAGEARYRAGAYSEAATIFAQVDEQSPSFPAALRILGLCKLRLGELSAALALLDRARGLAPDDPFA